MNPNLKTWVSLGVQKLYRYQHGDGGWHWWEFDQTDGDMTAYVLSGLLVARDYGYLVDDARLKRGENALIALAKQEGDLSKVFGLVRSALTPIDPKQASPYIGKLFAYRDKLDIYGQASQMVLTLGVPGVDIDSPQFAESGAGPARLRRRCRRDGRRVSCKADRGEGRYRQGRLTHWEGVADECDWRGWTISPSPRMSCAPCSPSIRHSPLIAPAIRWLMENRDGEAWSSTRSTSEAVLALTKYMQMTGELHPDYTVAVALDGRTLGTQTDTGSSAFDAPQVQTLTADMLKGAKTLTITKTGEGVLYDSEVVTYLVPSDQAVAQANGITVKRTLRYHRT